MYDQKPPMPDCYQKFQLPQTQILKFFSLILGPVSYTHLDVYKRQGRQCGQHYASAAHCYPQDVIPGTHFQPAESTWGLKNAP